MVSNLSALADMKSIALITGANKGLGFETARQLGAEHGFTVLLACRDDSRGREAENTLRAQGLDAHFVRLDVTDENSIRAGAQWVAQRFEKLDVLVNNAGIMLEHDPKIAGVALQTWRQTFDVNLFGVVAVTNAFLPLLEKSGAPRIVNLGAVLGSLSEISKPQMKTWIRASYSASKAALHAFTVELAQEKSGTNFKINAAHPGWAKTDMGGPNALLSAERGAKTIIQLATLPDDGPTGGLFHMGKPMNW